ncbi:MAG: hypothetical protein ACK5WS_04585 [Alphaproteobacteria bacterium]|jgi:outer membrane biosynthesis protein TonB|nr:hypothetical protein [Candidatus Jidaibacter sp.]
MKSPLYYSILLHASILLLAIFGLPFFSRTDVNQDFAMVVDVVPVSELTNVKVKTSDRKDNESTKTKKAPQAVEKEEDKKEEKKPETQKKENSKTQDLEAEKIPDKKVKEEKKKEEKKPEPIKEKKDDKKAKEEKKNKKPKDDSFEKSILKSLDADAKKKDEAKLDKEFKDLSDALKGDTNKAYNDAAPMSVSEIDSIKSQIVKNWNTSSFAGASDAAGMQVIVVIELDMNANVVNVKPKPQSNGSIYYNVFVESAVRAVKMSSPLQNLPQDKFHRWKEIEFKFDSTGMIY